MRIVGEEEDLMLSGWDPAAGEGPLVALGDPRGRDDGHGDPDIVLLDQADRAAGRGRVIAPSGPGLWRRSLWPVRDDVFELDPPADPGAVLVVHPQAERRDMIADGLRAHGARVQAAARLTPDALRASAVVVFVGGHGALPAQAACVLAARRVLVADATDAAFGLQSGVEYLLCRTADEAVERANTARVHPRATASLRALGARAARDHRASHVYPRLAADLAAAA